MSLSLEITFLGHAALTLETDGFRLITDPYSSEIGYAPINQNADLVTLSHPNPKWHSCLDELRTDAIYRGLENIGQTVHHGPFALEAIEVFENLPNDGPNAMVKISANGLHILHMGDCGHLPTPAQIEACGQVDILLALAGAGPTIALPDLMEFIEQLRPRIVIPMHFAVPHLAMKAAPVEELEALWKGEIARGDSHFSVSRETLPASPQLRVLKPLRMFIEVAPE